MTQIHYYCPSCDTPLKIIEIDPDDEYRNLYPDDGEGYDVYLECPCCGWSASATCQKTYSQAWEYVVAKLKQDTVLIVEPPNED